MAKALYRKYRPTQLSDVVGQDRVINTLQKSLEQGKISHAYLFVGPRGTGKTSVARIFAHEINKFKYEIEDSYVDIIEIDGASNRGIDDIRELREKANIAPTEGKYKIYIIDEVHMLTREAFNALLKTLEEPPKHVIFIMATTEVHKVPVTITSRSQIYTFTLANHTTMQKYLQKITKKEKIKITDDALEIIINRGGGSFRDTLSLLDQISTLSDQEITKPQIISALGLPSDEKITELLKVYLSGNITEITTSLNDLLTSGIKPETLSEEIINQIIKNPQPELFHLLEKLPEVKAPFPEAKLLLALCQNIKPKERPPIEAQSTRPAAKSFDQEKFLNEVKKTSDTIYLQLKKSTLEYNENKLFIYPNSKISETILAAKNNQNILKNLTPNLMIEIKKHTDKPSKIKNDQKITKISDIMGGEVKEDGGKNPF